MDPRDRADALLSRAQTREGVVTPDNMTSPMDAANTQQIPRSVVDRIDEHDPDSTTVLPQSVIDEARSPFAEQEPTTRMDMTPVRDREPAAEETDLGGLVPTSTPARRTQSELSRRLEGL